VTALLLAVLFGTAAAPASGAVAISVSGTGYDAGPVLAADGRVVVAERLANGVRRILAIDPQTHVISELTRVPAPGAGRFSVVRLTGSGGVVTATVSTYISIAGSTDEQATPPLAATRALQVLPTLAPLATCDPVRADFPAPILAAGGESFVALTGDSCRDRSALTIRTTNGTQTIPAMTGGSVAPEIMDLRAAGPFAIWTETRLDRGVTASFVAARAATGEVLLRAPRASGYDLAADGTVVVAQFGTCILRVVTLAPLAQRSVALPAGWCPSPLGSVAVAAGRAVYPTSGSYAVSDLQGGLHTVGDLPVDALGGQIAFDGTTLFGVRRRCLDELLLAADTTKPDGAPMPLTPAPTCVVRRAGSGRVRVAPDSRVSIRLRCPEGCRATLRLFEQRRGGRERLVATKQFSGGSKAFTVRPRIARYARALAGCRGGLRTVARVYNSSGRAKAIGAYRILSRSRCSRIGGPAFTRPRQGL